MSAPDSQINAILDRFDFEKVHRAMQVLDWRWHTTEQGMNQVPSRVDLRRSAREMLSQLSTMPKTRYMSTGGFVVRREVGGALSLAFEVDAVCAEPNGVEIP